MGSIGGSSVGGEANWQADPWVAQFLSFPPALREIVVDYLPIPTEDVALDPQIAARLEAMNSRIDRTLRLLNQVRDGTMDVVDGSDH